MTDVYVTPTAAEGVRLAELGARIVALDATRGPARPLVEMFAAVHAAGALVIGDVSTLDEARVAYEHGADLVSPHPQRYTPTGG